MKDICRRTRTLFIRRQEKQLDWRDYVEIIHVHGQMGELKDQLFQPVKTCWEWPQGIKVIREVGKDEVIPDAHQRARTLVAEASKLYFCGFAFAKANTDLLGLKEGHPEHSREIHYCNFASDVGLRNSAEKFAIKKEQSATGDSMEKLNETRVFEYPKLGVADWIGTGTLGELP